MADFPFRVTSITPEKSAFAKSSYPVSGLSQSHCHLSNLSLVPPGVHPLVFSAKYASCILLMPGGCPKLSMKKQGQEAKGSLRELL